jgi:hypothetical protein
VLSTCTINGHRAAVKIRRRPILEYGDAIGGATVLFEEAFVNREESCGPPMYRCLDATTGIPSRRIGEKFPTMFRSKDTLAQKPFTGMRSHSNWELSADRANATRRLMQQSGLRPDQVSQVRSFADQRLRNLKNALDPSNRRISIIVQYISSDTDEAESPGRDTKETGDGKKDEK